MSVFQSILALVLVLFMVVLPHKLVRAADFIDSLYDVPMMAGMVELREGGSVFDTPSGRIAEEVVIAPKQASESGILRFYALSLPEMGWKPLGGGVFTREGERLEVMIKAEAVESEGLVLFVFFLLMPHG